MNMKKLMAGFAAASLAVTSLATVSFADAEFAEFAKFSGNGQSSDIDRYTVTVDVNGSIVGADGGTLTLNVDTQGDISVGNNPITYTAGVVDMASVDYPYYYTKGDTDYGVAIVGDIKLVFRYHGVEIEVVGQSKGGTTEWEIDDAATLPTPDDDVATVEAWLAANQYMIPEDFSLDVARVRFDVQIFSTKHSDPNNARSDVIFNTKLTNDLSDVIKTTDITSYGRADALQILLENGATIKVDNTVAAEDTGYSLAVKRGAYGVKPVYVDDSDGIVGPFKFFTEDVTIGATGADVANSGKTTYRLNATQQSDVRALAEENPDAKVKVTVKFFGKVSADDKSFTVTTDLMQWRREGADRIAIAKDATEITFDLPLKDFYDAGYRVGYSSGFLSALAFDFTGVTFVSASGNAGGTPGAVLEVLIEYPKPTGAVSGETPAGPGASGNTPEDDEPFTLTSNGVSATAPMSVLRGNGATSFEVEAEVTATSVTYELHLLDKDGKSVQPAGEVTLKLPIPEAGQGKALKDNVVTHTCNDGTVEKLAIVNATTYKTDNYVIVKTSKFSSFEFEWEEDEAGNGGEGGEATPNPDTGVVLAVIPAIAAAAGVVVFKKRK